MLFHNRWLQFEKDFCKWSLRSYFGFSHQLSLKWKFVALLKSFLKTSRSMVSTWKIFIMDYFYHLYKDQWLLKHLSSHLSWRVLVLINRSACSCVSNQHEIYFLLFYFFLQAVQVMMNKLWFLISAILSHQLKPSSFFSFLFMHTYNTK